MKDVDLAGIAVMLPSLALAVWGVCLLIKPSLLRPGTFIYRWIYWRWFAQTSKDSDEKLSEQQIRYYALAAAILGFFWRRSALSTSFAHESI